jgi:hypothetical protein
MKVSSEAATALGNNKDSKEVPPLSLFPDEDELEQNNAAKKGTFKLLSDPSNTDSQKYSFTMTYADGSQSIRFQIKWVKDVQKILRGMCVTMPAAQHELIQRLCTGQVLTQCNESIMIACQTAKTVHTRAIVAGLRRRAATAMVTAETQNEVADKAVPPDAATLAMIKPVLRSTIKMVCPYKALEKQRCFMRCKMRKPADMKIRTFVNHLHRINFDELPQLPPFETGQELSNNKLLDIILFGIPKSWVKEMNRQDFDPFAREDIQMLILCCKCMESAEDLHDNNNKPGSNSKNSHKKTKFSDNKGKPTKGSGKWCEYHKTDMHDTSECLGVEKDERKWKEQLLQQETFQQEQNMD